MASIAPPKLQTEELEPTLIDGLSDAAYFNEVLRLPLGKLEVHIDDELVSRAQQLGISISQAIDDADDKRYTISAQSASTAATYHARTFSTGSHDSASTDLTIYSSIFAPPSSESTSLGGKEKGQPKTLSFQPYDKYLTQVDKNLDQPKFCKVESPTDSTAKSLFSISTKKSLFSVKSGLKGKIRWRRKSIQPFPPNLSCVCCRDDFQKSNTLHSLPCGHTYCASCLRVMISQSTTEESKMPPRCCTQPIPTNIVKAVLPRETQQVFLKAVVQFSTPWEARIFCPNADCGEFIPPRHKIDPKHPFNVTCRKCDTRACVTCKRNAHPVGKDCPEDWELEAVLKMGEKSGWRRCYKCRNLVELAQGCTHMTCRCKAQFCYICGGVWNPSVGCPNVCNGEEELERRRIEEQERLAKLEVEKAAQVAAAAEEAVKQKEAEERSNNHEAFQQLIKSQEDEIQRFQEFAAKGRIALKERQTAQKKALEEKYAELGEKMKERHTKTAGHLEDRQVAAEMELRNTLEQSERSVKIRLKHMEAYCEGLGRSPSTDMPQRTVTERDLRELGQQYNLRDNMERLHQSKINVMRDRQAKRMEELLDRQEVELENNTAKRQEELESLISQHALELEEVDNLCKSRQERLRKRWELSVEVLCKETEKTDGLRYAQIPVPTWPDAEEEVKDGTAVDSENAS
ncbi:unnamed protein product [Clonostachys chloroleuca]|uniref:RBR-type E3 ubiquitin transferase n=1 Tax=Clonostachys chloroleuca TaxID=1926264 RepID=A0AA35MBN8_9HYPO|nr:unnamed protein product [Clonostachys chloroleuca]